MPPRPLLQLLASHAVLLALFGVLGLLLDQVFAALFVGALLGLIWHLGHLYQLDCWLRDDRRRYRPPPQVSDATWGNIYQRFLLLDKRNRKRKRKLNRIVKRFRAGVAALPDAVVVLNADRQVEWCNRTAQTMLGISPRDAGLPITSLLRSPAFIRFMANPKDAPEAATVIDSPLDSAVQISLRLTEFGKKQLLLLATDVSASLHLERMRRDFVANASHELRTPLTVMVGYLEVLMDSPEFDRPPWQQPLRHMQEQSQRMRGVIEDLLLLSRLETEPPPPGRPVDVTALLGQLTADARSLSGRRGHTFTLRADPQLWLQGAERELRSAFANLLFNAVRHTPDGTAVEVGWRTDPQGRPVFAVRDDGPGIAEQHLRRLTERFYRVDRDRSRSTDSGGTGLGLAISKHVAQRHNGKLEIDSELGVGSVFSCRFAASQRSAAPPEDGNHAQKTSLTTGDSTVTTD